MMELDALQALTQDVKNLGATLIGISPQTVESSKAMINENKLTFPILTDEDSQIAGKFGLVFKLSSDLKEVYLKFGINLEDINKNNAWELPIPTRFIINTQGRIVDRQANCDYTKRAEPLKMIEILKSL